MNLHSFDERWLPALARAVQRRALRLRELGAGLTGPGSVIGAATRLQPALAGSIAVVGLAAVMLAAAGGPGGPGNNDSDNASLPSQPAVPVTTTIGPTPGASVASYLTHASFNLRKFGETSHDQPGYAVVDLHAYLRPDQAARVFNGVDVVRAYVRVPSRNLPTQVHAIPLQSTFTTLGSGMEGSGRLAAATAHTFGELVNQLKPRTSQDRELRTRYALQKQASSYEAAALLRPSTCACVFSVVVHAKDSDLLRLAASPEVRAVDPAPVSVSLSTLTVFPLEPEIVTIVPRGGLLGG